MLNKIQKGLIISLRFIVSPVVYPILKIRCYHIKKTKQSRLSQKLRQQGILLDLID
jgi:hypothetical protein